MRGGLGDHCDQAPIVEVLMRVGCVHSIKTVVTHGSYRSSYMDYHREGHAFVIIMYK